MERRALFPKRINKDMTCPFASCKYHYRCFYGVGGEDGMKPPLTLDHTCSNYTIEYTEGQ